MVSTSNHVLVNMSDFGDDLEIEGFVVAAKRSHCDDDTHSVVRVTERQEHQHHLRVMQMLCATSADAEELTTNQDHLGKKNPPAFNQKSPALQSELRKLQHVNLVFRKAEWDKVGKAADKAISLLQPGSKTSDVAATFPSHTTG